MLARPPADSAGRKFEGRALPDARFAGDDGQADRRLRVALEAVASGGAGEQGVLAALSTARVFTAVAALAADVGAAGGHLMETSTDLALAVLVDSRGGRALPVFTDAAALTRWRPDARPVPVDGRRAALAAAAEGAETLVLDPAGPVTCVLAGRAALEGLARGHLAVAAHVDPGVDAHVLAVVSAVAAVRSAYVLASAEADVVVHLDLDSTLTAEEIAALADALRRTPRWWVRGLAVTAGGEPPAGAGRRVYDRANPATRAPG